MQLRKLLWLLAGLVVIAALVLFKQIDGAKQGWILPDQDQETVQTPELIGIISTYGDERSFIRPSSVAVAPNGHIYVVDSQANKIIIYDTSGRYLNSFGTSGSKQGQLAYPLGIAVGRDGRVYITEVVNCRIQVFSAKGEFLKTFPKESNSLTAPTAIAVDSSDKVYVFDKQDHLVKVYNALGESLFTFGGKGTEPGKFKYAMGLAISSKGHIYVSDSGNSRIQTFDSKGGFLREIQPKTQAMSNPRGIALNEQGQLYVADSLLNDVINLDDPGTSLSFKDSQTMDGFSFPDGLAYKNHRLYVVDKGNKRLVVFQLPK